MKTGLIRRSLRLVVAVVMGLPGRCVRAVGLPDGTGRTGKTSRGGPGVPWKGGDMGLWHMFYAGWQMECCRTPFQPGDEVSWPLLLSDAPEVLGGDWHDQLTRIPVWWRTYRARRARPVWSAGRRGSRSRCRRTPSTSSRRRTWTR
ncbi:DUF6578 domain-containing protein [Streptomyces sp. NBC_00847]|uniref:DUF6578 domain-containing protein n=1 Tax=Streptomyces sp. NBC_00847 TaxID=2975850 RepID=UPI002B1E4586|nr:DUF6578 domain-containing protein [Streptomyces sp. NBC_00847]